MTFDLMINVIDPLTEVEVAQLEVCGNRTTIYAPDDSKHEYRLEILMAIKMRTQAAIDSLMTDEKQAESIASDSECDDPMDAAQPSHGLPSRVLH